MEHKVLILQALRKITRAIDIHSRKLSSEFSITAPQIVALVAIAEGDNLTLAGLAEKIHLSASTVVGIVDRLEAKKLAKRKRSKVDRRRVEISITEKGKKYLKSAPSPLQDKLSSELEKMEKAELETILKSLEKLCEMMQAEDIDAAPILESGDMEKSKIL